MSKNNLTGKDLELIGFTKDKSKDGRFNTWESNTYGIQLWGGFVYIYENYKMFDREEQVFKGTVNSVKELKVLLNQVGYE